MEGSRGVGQYRQVLQLGALNCSESRQEREPLLAGGNSVQRHAWTV